MPFMAVRAAMPDMERMGCMSFGAMSENATGSSLQHTSLLHEMTTSRIPIPTNFPFMEMNSVLSFLGECTVD